MEQTRQHESFSATHDKASHAASNPDPGVQEQLRNAGTTIKEQAQQAADDAKAAGGIQIAGVSRVVHKAADELGRELPQAAGFIHAAADRLDQVSSALRERSVEDLMCGFNSFARRQPMAAFAGSVLAGFALARFLKSSPAHSKSNPNR